jgi:[ribosomal protein S18]-alanine N-acetyltransferase
MFVAWKIRRASPADLEAVLAVERACDEAPHWSRASWREALSAEDGVGLTRASFVAEDTSGVIGFCVFSRAGELAELESVAVSERARRQGVGRALCRHGMEWSRNLGATAIELEVRASSEGALALYRLLGFVDQGRRRGYYHDPTEDAVLMAAALPS